MSGLGYDTLVQRRPGLTRDLPEGVDENLNWVANSSTLIYGDHDAVLVDTFVTVDENERLVEWVKDHGRALTYLYLTHGHGDHIYGIGQVLEAFPEARAVATAGTVAEARRAEGSDLREGFFEKLFPGRIPQPVPPGELAGDTIMLEEDKLRAIGTGQTDTAGSTVLWSPARRLLVCGDVVYSHTHMYLGETTRSSREHWIAVLIALRELGATHVVAGHKPPGGRDDPADISESIRYLIDFNDAEAAATSAMDLYQTMLRKYPGRINPGSLWNAANAAYRR